MFSHVQSVSLDITYNWLNKIFLLMKRISRKLFQHKSCSLCWKNPIKKEEREKFSAIYKLTINAVIEQQRLSIQENSCWSLGIFHLVSMLADVGRNGQVNLQVVFSVGYNQDSAWFCRRWSRNPVMCYNLPSGDSCAWSSTHQRPYSWKRFIFFSKPVI